MIKKIALASLLVTSVIISFSVINVDSVEAQTTATVTLSPQSVGALTPSIATQSVFNLSPNLDFSCPILISLSSPSNYPSWKFSIPKNGSSGWSSLVPPYNFYVNFSSPNFDAYLPPGQYRLSIDDSIVYPGYSILNPQSCLSASFTHASGFVDINWINPNFSNPQTQYYPLEKIVSNADNAPLDGKIYGAGQTLSFSVYTRLNSLAKYAFSGSDFSIKSEIFPASGSVPVASLTKSPPNLIANGANNTLLISFGIPIPPNIAPGQYFVRASVAIAGTIYKIDSGNFNVVASDTTGPTINSFLPADGQTIQGLINLTADVTDSGSGVDRVEFNSPNGVNVDSLPPYALSFNTANYSDGPYPFRIDAYDKVGNRTNGPIYYLNILNHNFVTPLNDVDWPIGSDLTVSWGTLSDTSGVVQTGIAFVQDGITPSTWADIATTYAPYPLSRNSITVSLSPNDPRFIVGQQYRAVFVVQRGMTWEFWISPGRITITPQAVPFSISISSPTASQVYYPGSTVNVEWTTTNDIPSTTAIRMFLKTSAGVLVNPIPNGITIAQGTNDGTQTITLSPTLPPGQYYITVTTANLVGNTNCLAQVNCPASVNTPTFTVDPVAQSTQPSIGSEKLTGWAWSSNIGWISFDLPGTADQYGVRINEGTGNSLNGYAWSPKIGWVNFGPTSGFPGAPANGAKLVTVAGVTIIDGWARACSVFVSGCSGSLRGTDERGNWDGWIKMSATPVNSVRQYEVKVETINNAKKLTGFAWGSNNIGWVKFDNVGITDSGDKKLMLTVNGNLSVTDNSAVPNTCAPGPGLSTVVCTFFYPANSTVILTPTPSSGLTWSGTITAVAGDIITNCPANGTSCVLLMDKDRVVNVDGNITKYVLTMTSLPLTVSGNNIQTSESGTVVPCSIPHANKVCKEYPSGTTVTLNSAAKPGYQFNVWGGACPSAGPCIVQMTSNKSVTASFVVQHNLDVTVIGNGSVTVSASGYSSSICPNPGPCNRGFMNGTNVTLIASGAGLIWEGDCAGVSGNTCSLNMNADKTVTANFAGGEGGIKSEFSVGSLMELREYSVSTPVSIKNNSIEGTPNKNFCVRSIKSTLPDNQSIEQVLAMAGCGDTTKYPKCYFKNGDGSVVSNLSCSPYNQNEPPYSTLGPGQTGELRLIIGRYCSSAIKAKQPYTILVDDCAERSSPDPDINSNTRAVDFKFLPVTTCEGDC